MSDRRQPHEAMDYDRGMDAILASLADGVVAIDDGWRITCVNPAAERLWRRKASELIGVAVFDALALPPGDACREGLLASKAANAPAAFSARIAPLGAWLELRGSPAARGYAIVFRDVSEERRAHLARADDERGLEITRRTNQRVFETTLDLILVTSRTGEIFQVSPSVYAILGYRPDEIAGRSARDFVHPDDLERTRNEMRMARRGHVLRNFETRYVHKDGHAVPLAWTGVWSDGEQQHFFIGRDMSERNAAEERLRRAQRLDSIGQLTGGIAHDFNNLLTIVIGNLDLLEARLAGDAKAAGYAGTALKAALRGAELTRQLLAFARRQPLDAKAIDINERVAATMALLQRTLGENIEITPALAPDLWPALADPTQLESALINLAINARDAMPQGGKLQIETANKRIDESYVAKNFDATPGDYVMLAVSDTGTGMPPDVAARAFDPFFTTKPTGKGTGLGLSMVYGFVKQSQGHVQIDSEVGHGTSVRVYLPRAAGAGEAAAEAAGDALPPAQPGECILAVEDNADVRKVVSAQLAELGYRVIEAPHGDGALRLLAQGEPVHLLFSDLVMPGGMSGYDLARAARRLRPGLKILLTSGFPKAPANHAETAGEFPSLLIKPYRKADLAARIRAALDS
jgi:PAS domain S-box-containing protein